MSQITAKIDSRKDADEKASIIETRQRADT